MKRWSDLKQVWEDEQIRELRMLVKFETSLKIKHLVEARVTNITQMLRTAGTEFEEISRKISNNNFK